MRRSARKGLGGKKERKKQKGDGRWVGKGRDYGRALREANTG